jgi:ferrous iron transport protein B
VTEVLPLLPNASISPRSLALMALAGDEALDEWLEENVTPEAMARLQAVRDRLEAIMPGGVGYQINRERLATVDDLLAETVRQTPVRRATLSQHLGRLAMHPVWGIPILLAVLYVVFQFVGIWGAGTLVGLMEETLFGEHINPFVTNLVNAMVPFALVRDFLIGEYGLVTMALTYAIALILPIVTTFFIAFGILEDSGYLPRLAVMADRVFRLMGLNGKAVLPMILGLGCDTMATLTTRILESKKERVLVTLLLSLGVPCTAQLAVIMAMFAGLSGAARSVYLGVIVGTIFLVGWAASKVVPGDTSDFVLELPPLRVPQAKNILMKTLARIEWYLKEAVPLFVIGTVILFVGAQTGILKIFERAMSPVVVNLLGLPSQSSNMFIMGFLRRDYGAAGFLDLWQKGQLDPIQTVVSLITITLFIPCIAQFFVTIKERGLRTALGIAGFTMTYAVGAAALVNFALRAWGVRL